MKIVLNPSEKIDVTFDGTDGRVTVEFREEALVVVVDQPDESGRTGVIYEAELV